MIRTRARLAVAAGAGLLVACTQTDMPGDQPADPCAAAATCVDLEIDSFMFLTIDQLELDVVIDRQHAAGSPRTTGTVGQTVDLPTSLHLALDLPGPSPIDVDVIAAGKLNGSVLGTAGRSVTVQQGQQATVGIFLQRADPCVEGELYCGGTDSTAGADGNTLYRCTGGVPIFYASCSSVCLGLHVPHAVCYGGGGTCRDGGTYCGGDAIDGDPNRLYVCSHSGTMTSMLCPRSCVVRGGGNDACQ